MQKFLLHTCCAPCSIAVIDELKSQYDLTVFFYNPNIYPEEEYLKRKKEVVKVCEEWGVKIIDFDYDQSSWDEAIKGLENEPEGGARCPKCFAMRLEKTAQCAKENNYDIFCTTLTSGRNKLAEIINPIGRMLGEKYGVEFLEADWKKEGRQEKGKCMVQERNIYRQDYCGCKYSLQTKS
ncbi:MAG: epoxyqueuosine reductase QueH [Candidatus Magasanikiibacteriota bacterium]